MDDVAAWLEHMGLPEVINTFRRNNVNGQLFKQLLPEDLIAMGEPDNLAMEVCAAGCA